MVDMATRFCSASVISNKLPNTIINVLFIHWILILGAPWSILSDNGREFNNSIMQDLGEVCERGMRATEWYSGR